MRVNHQEADLENHDRGLDYDLPRLLRRRGLLTMVAGASVVALTGCATAEVTSSGTTAPTTVAHRRRVPRPAAADLPVGAAARARPAIVRCPKVRCRRRQRVRTRATGPTAPTC